MKGSNILALSLRIIRQFRRDRRTVGLLFVVPISVLSLLMYLLNGPQTPARIVVQGGSQSLRLALVNTLEASRQGFEVVETEPPDPEEALRSGRIDGVLVLPAAGGSSNSRSSSLPLFGMLPRTTSVKLIVEGSQPQVTAKLIAGMREALGRSAALAEAPLAGGVLTRLDVKYLYAGPEFTPVDYLAPGFIGLFGFFFVFLLTSVSFLRERLKGTLVRLAASPLTSGEIILGYTLGFALFALVQTSIVILFVIYVLDVRLAGNVGLVWLIQALLTIGAVNLGIFLSAFARNELQVVQFIPIAFVPQILLSGLVVSLKAMPASLAAASYFMPLTYANTALTGVMIKGLGLGDIWPELLALSGFALLFTIAGAAIVKRGAR